jgi:hypothetical protein
VHSKCETQNAECQVAARSKVNKVFSNAGRLVNSLLERFAEPRRVQEQIVPFRDACGSLCRLTIIADRLLMVACPLEEMCARLAAHPSAA